MSLLVESIKLENGQLRYVADHEKRMNNSRKALFGSGNPLKIDIDLRDSRYKRGVFKCRVLYTDVIHTVDIQSYTPRTIKYLKLIENNEIDYSHKYADRRMFDSFLPPYSPDEAFIIVKNGFLTDTTFSNIALYDGIKWVTPSTFLLNGTLRQRLLRDGVLSEAEIRPTDLHCFSKIKLINAMLDWKSAPEIDTKSIIL